MENEFLERRNKIEEILKASLPVKGTEAWKEAAFGELNPAVTDTHLANLLNPCRNLMDQGGKRWRPLLLVLCAELASECCMDSTTRAKAVENAYRLTPLLEFVHTASLIHDDIEDNADMRRGKSAAHISFGLDTALNAASWLYFQAACCISTIDADDSVKKQFYDLYAQELRRLHLGQAMDIYWHRNPSVFPTHEEYTAMVGSKTGTLSSLAAKTGFLAGGASKELSDKAGKTAAGIGVGFQILDDVQNLTTGNPGKRRGDDIVEGKKSLPVLLHIKKHPEDKEQLAEYFEQAARDGMDSPAVEAVIALLEKSGAIDEAFAMGKEMVQLKTIELTRILSDNNSAGAGSGTEIQNLIIKLFDSLNSAQKS